MRVSMLDMGERKYGDATFCEIDGISVLVDGAHRGDDQDRGGGTLSVTQQLAELTGHPAPFEIDLLVVTHCHSDHIGCLPELVRDGVILPKWALIADPRIGFGVPLAEAFPLPKPDRSQRVAEALREEPLRADAPAAEIRELIDTAATLQERYAAIIAALERMHTKVVRYGRDAHFALERGFEKIGLKIIGPTVDQLLICAHHVERDRLARARAAAAAAALMDGADDEVALYRRLVEHPLSDGEDLGDGRSGAALNNQSIVLRLGSAPDAILLTGDMQFAASGVGGLGGRMDALRQVTTNAGPYAFARLSHHGASNGTDSRFLDSISETTAFGISTGSGDAGHPSASVLSLLAGRSPAISWARTDTNGLFTLGLKNGEMDWKKARGTLSDFMPNEKIVKPVGTAAVPATPMTSPAKTGPTGQPGRLDIATRLTFVTVGATLRDRLGDAADQAMDAVRSAGHIVLDLQSTDLAPIDIAKAARGSKGIVILGGHGVVPSLLIDALPPRLRRPLRGGSIDPEDFVVWSDDPYGDADGVGLPQIPVSRIPDAGDGSFLLKALNPAIRTSTGRYGLRNALRPFADDVFAGIVGPQLMQLSEPLRLGELKSHELDVENVYLVLHGYEDDGSVFSGETQDPTASDPHVQLMNTTSLPDACSATVFTGACYGALIVHEPGLAELTVRNSIALSFLNAGARAFVGCTGTHWSPRDPPYQSAAGPFHKAFWKEIAGGRAPAEALMNAKIDYAFGMPYDGEEALEYKTWRQFTCLGLGW